MGSFLIYSGLILLAGNHLVPSAGFIFGGNLSAEIGTAGVGGSFHANISSNNGINWHGNASVGVNSTAGNNSIVKFIQILEAVLKLASNNKNASSEFVNEAVETLGGALGAALNLSRSSNENNPENALNAIIIVMNGAIRGGLQGQLTDPEINRLIEEIDAEIREAASRIRTARGAAAIQIILDGVLGTITTRLTGVIRNGDGLLLLIRSLVEAGLRFISTGSGNITDAIKFVITQLGQSVQRALKIPQSIFELFISQFIKIIDQLSKIPGRLVTSHIIEKSLEQLIARLEGVGGFASGAIGTITRDISKLIHSGQDLGRQIITDGIDRLFGLGHLFGIGQGIGTQFGFNATLGFQILNNFIKNLNQNAFKFGGNLVGNIVSTINSIIEQGSSSTQQVFNILNEFQRIIESQVKNLSDFRSTIVGTVYSLITEIYKRIGVDSKTAQSEINQFIGEVNGIISDYQKLGQWTRENLEEMIGKIRGAIDGLVHLPQYLRNLIAAIISGEIRIYFNIVIQINDTTNDNTLSEEQIDKLAGYIIDILKNGNREFNFSKDELERKIKASGHLEISIGLTGFRRFLEGLQSSRRITKQQLDQIWRRLVGYLQKNRISLKNLPNYIDQLIGYAFAGLEGKIDASVEIELKAEIRFYIVFAIFTNINNVEIPTTGGTSTKSGGTKSSGKPTTIVHETTTNGVTEKSVTTSPHRDQTTVEKSTGAETRNVKNTTPLENQTRTTEVSETTTLSTLKGETRKETEVTISTIKGETTKAETETTPNVSETTGGKVTVNATIDINDFEKRLGINFTQNSALKVYFELGIDFSRIFLLSLNGSTNGSIQTITNEIRATIYRFNLKFIKFNRNEFKVFINALIWNVVLHLDISSARAQAEIAQLTTQINAILGSYQELSISDLLKVNRELENLISVSFPELSERQRNTLKFILNVSLSIIVQEETYGSFNYNSTTGQITINSKFIINIIEQLLPKNYFLNFGIDSLSDFIKIIQNALSKGKLSPLSEDNLLKQIELQLQTGLNITTSERNALYTAIKRLADSQFQSGIRSLAELSEFLSAANKILIERLRGRIDQAILNQFILQLDISITLQFTIIQIQTTKTSNSLIKDLIKGGINLITNGVKDINLLASNTILNGINNFKFLTDFGFNSAGDSVKFGSHTVNNTVNTVNNIVNKILDQL